MTHPKFVDRSTLEAGYHSTQTQKETAHQWFQDLQKRIITAFEAIEAEFGGEGSPASFDYRLWKHKDSGGGVSALMRGKIFEKVGVNVSCVQGEFLPEFAARIPGAQTDHRYWASGISLVAHMASPLVPAVHMNTRHIVTTQSWFGGGADLTPYYPFAEDTAAFHEALQRACDAYDPICYPRFKAWCDEYFYLPHRQEPRGVGGIFYDNLNSGCWDKDFAFTQSVGEAFLSIYPQIVQRRCHLPWTPAQRTHQLRRRGRYVEFNLLHDRGTLFGLKTGGNIEAILMSLPPVVEWE